MARWLWIVSALVSLVQVMVELADRERLVAEIRKREPALSQDDVDVAVQGGMVFTLLIVGVIVLLYVKAANRMAQGRNWARVVLTLVGGASVVYGLLQLAVATELPVVDTSLAVAGLGLNGTAIALMYVPTAAAWFASRVSGVDRVPDQP
ncbi:hypothetical protein Lesp02_28910 [Lentzea sp. NBRC 105346]|nr:hypothetical protein Lesp02_28910 [Lentzea sp. NBRC 105346]